MSLGDESDSEPMSMDMLEDIRDGIQSRPRINLREQHYKIRDCILKKASGMERSVIINTKYEQSFTQIL